MTTAQERMKILKMVAEGKITAEEASKLIAAISKSDKQEPVSGASPRWLRVKVTEVDSGKQQVNVNVPFEMIQIGLRMGARFVPEMDGVEIQELINAVQAGVTGKIVDIIDDDDGKRVEVYVE
ncbi:MAG: hypothetical protein JXA25_05025 [Anaerolineales bacterium]|nr:hypothetical protein [Anaerolineales bacterium]